MWLLLEVAGYFVLSPFAAARRVLGIVVVATILAGRLASRTRLQPERRALVYGVTTAGVCLGLAFFIVDCNEALIEQKAVESAAAWIRERAPDARIWFAGHWGFQYYAEQAGMLPLLPTDERPRPGEWVVVPDARVTQQPWRAGVDRGEVMTVLRWDDALGLRTVPCYYGGNSALEHHEGPRLCVTILRIKPDAVPDEVPWDHYLARDPWTSTALMRRATVRLTELFGRPRVALYLVERPVARMTAPVGN
jgi:hypothetical protein